MSVASIRSITLSAGALQMSALEVGAGPLVLCLHGFPDTLLSFRHQLPALAGAGFRAIAPMMRGYQPSSQPADRDYHVVRLAEDVLAWLDHLGERQCHLIGHDWGAITAYAAAALAPERFISLTTLAVPPTRRMARGLLRYPSQLKNSWYMLFFQLRGLADHLVRRDDFAFLERLWRDWSPGWAWAAEDMAALKQTFAEPGVLTAALGYYRAFFTGGAAARQTRELLRARIDVPTLALTGATDGCLDTRLYDVVCDPRDFPGGLRVERVTGAGHFLHQERPDEVNRLVLDWLSE
jgi:pimeloyl-ACP methyl ester carboxylesterase